MRVLSIVHVLCDVQIEVYNVLFRLLDNPWNIDVHVQPSFELTNESVEALHHLISRWSFLSSNI